MTRQRLIIEDNPNRRPIPFKGRAAVEQDKALRRLIRESDGPVDILARPVTDDISDEIDWYTDLPGEAVSLNQLTGRARAQAESLLEKDLAALKLIAQEAVDSGQTDRAELGRLLERIVSEVSPDNIFAVDGVPVIADWGRTDSPVDQDIPQRTAAATQDADSNALDNIQSGEDVKTEQSEPISRRGMGLLTIIASVSAVFALIAVGLRMFGLLPGLPAMVGPRVLDVTELAEIHAQNTTLRQEIDALREELFEARALCVASCQSEETTPPPLPTPGPEPETEPEPLTVPPEPEEGERDLTFLEGLWRAVTGLTNKDEIPIDFVLDLDATGQGEVRVTEEDGTICTGAVSASFPDPQMLVFELTSAQCSETYFYSAATITCNIASDGQAICEGLNLDGDRISFNVTIVKVQP